MPRGVTAALAPTPAADAGSVERGAGRTIVVAALAIGALGVWVLPRCVFDLVAAGRGGVHPPVRCKAMGRDGKDDSLRLQSSVAGHSMDTRR